MMLISEDGDYYTEDHYERQVPGEKGLLDWLTSTELLHTLTSSTTELLDVVNQLKVKDRGRERGFKLILLSWFTSLEQNLGEGEGNILPLTWILFPKLWHPCPHREYQRLIVLRGERIFIIY